MDHLIERVARYTDIDTRRALGFPPRRLPPRHFDFPEREDLAGYVTVQFSCEKCLIWHYLEDQPVSYLWIFGYNLNILNHRVYGMDYMGGISIRSESLESKKSRHPDFNEDGSLKSWRSL
jgi:hypothetical protein